MTMDGPAEICSRNKGRCDIIICNPRRLEHGLVAEHFSGEPSVISGGNDVPDDCPDRNAACSDSRAAQILGADTVFQVHMCDPVAEQRKRFHAILTAEQIIPGIKGVIDVGYGVEKV